MNTRTTKTTVTWHLELSEAEDAAFRDIIIKPIAYPHGWDRPSVDIAHKIWSLIPKGEEKEDEKKPVEMASGYYHCSDCGAVFYRKAKDPCEKCGTGGIVWVNFGPDDDRHGPGTDTTIEWIATEQQLDRINDKISMGQAADGGNAGGARAASAELPGDQGAAARCGWAEVSPAALLAKTRAAANSQGDMADMPDVRASSTDANLRAAKLAKLADVCSGRCKDPVAKSWDKFSHGPVEPVWDKPRW